MLCIKDIIYSVFHILEYVLQCALRNKTTIENPLPLSRQTSEKNPNANYSVAADSMQKFLIPKFNNLYITVWYTV